VAQPSAGYGLDAPTSAAVVGSDLFVANGLGDSVTEVNGSSGAHVATISGASFGFDDPTAILAVGHHLFVTNGADGVVTEIDAGAGRRSGSFLDSLIRCPWLPRAGTSTSSNGNRLGSQGVDRVGKADGLAWGPQFGFDIPSGIASCGRDLFVANSGVNSVAEVNARTMGVRDTAHGAALSVRHADGWGRPRARRVGHEQDR